MIRPSSPGEPDHIWYVSLEWFWGNSPKLELKTWTAGNPVTQGCGCCPRAYPPTRGPGALGGSQLTQRSAGCLARP